MKGKLCGAKTRAGTPCKRLARWPQGRCRLHGGCSLMGAAHPNYKDGRRSKYVPRLGPLGFLGPLGEAIRRVKAMQLRASEA